MRVMATSHSTTISEGRKSAKRSVPAGSMTKSRASALFSPWKSMATGMLPPLWCQSQVKIIE